MPIYDKPTKILMKDFAAGKIRPGQFFDKQLAIDWFRKNYPNIKSNTIAMHVEGMSINSNSRKHHPNIKPGSDHDLFFKLGPNEYRLWDPDRDPSPIYRGTNTDSSDSSTEEINPQIASAQDYRGSEEFAFERDLRNYLAKNLSLIELGLNVYQEEEFSGIEFPVGGRFIDILAKDKNDGFVVIELKVSRGYDRVIGQLLRYMAWVQQNLAANRQVRGIIVASDVTDDLRLAASLIQNVLLFEYTIAMKLSQVRIPDSL